MEPFRRIAKGKISGAIIRNVDERLVKFVTNKVKTVTNKGKSLAPEPGYKRSSDNLKVRSER
jgi:hypothetical protein